MLFKNAIIVTMNEKHEILENYDLQIENNVIKKIAKNIDEKNNQAIDLKGKLIIPGLINTHTHLPMSIFRSLGEEKEDRLMKYVFPIEGKFINPKNVEIATKYTLLETIKSGMTTICDMYYYDQIIAKVLNEANVRGVLGETIIDNGGENFNKEFGKFEHLDKLVKEYKDNNLITPMIAPHAPYTNSEKSLIKCNEYAKENNLLKMIHISEMKFEDGPYKGFASPIQYLDSLGFLDEKTILVHSIYINDDDIKTIQKNKCKISHNPVSNAKGGREIMKMKKLLEANVTVGLGTDGQMSGNLLDLQSVMYFTNKIHKYKEQDRSFLSNYQIFKMVTIDAAKVINKEKEIGSIEIGKKADLVVVDYEKPNMYPMYDIYTALVNSFTSENIDKVIVDGKIIYEDNQYKTVDYEKTFENFKKLVKEVKEYVKQ